VSDLARGQGDRVERSAIAWRFPTATSAPRRSSWRVGELEAAERRGARRGRGSARRSALRVHDRRGYRVKAEVASALGNTHQAEDDFRRAIDILAAVKHEVELARAYNGLAAVKERTGGSAEAQKLRGRAVDIFTRLRGAAATE
jgi:hypothetical protein